MCVATKKDFDDTVAIHPTSSEGPSFSLPHLERVLMHVHVDRGSHHAINVVYSCRIFQWKFSRFIFRLPFFDQIDARESYILQQFMQSPSFPLPQSKSSSRPLDNDQTHRQTPSDERKTANSKDQRPPSFHPRDESESDE